MDRPQVEGVDMRAARLDARFVSAERQNRLTEAIHAGRLHEIARLELLAGEQLQGLARASLALLLGSSAVVLALEIAARAVHRAPPLPGAGTPLLVLGLIVGNLLVYAAILPLHEGVHALVILLLGGRPTFGLKMPLAAYCTAPGQLFTREGYTIVALAPLVLLSLAGFALIWLVPNVAAYLLFGLVGNISGAVGDLAAARRTLAFPSDTLIADTATGFIAYLPDSTPAWGSLPTE
jgi:hypothetical protein